MAASLALSAIALMVVGLRLGIYRFGGATAPQVGTTTESSVLTPVAPPPAKSSADRLANIKAFLDGYDGGDCFFVMPVAVGQTATVIEGYGASNGSFQAFSSSFKKQQGFEPSVGVRQITDAQCPAVRFLAQLHGDQSRAARIVLASSDVRNGELLSGSLENVANGATELLLITDKGAVKNLSDLLKPSLDSMSFSIGLQSADASVRPQLLMALTSSRPIAALKQAQAKSAGEFFESVLNEARKSNLAVASAVRYFRLGG